MLCVFCEDSAMAVLPAGCSVPWKKQIGVETKKVEAILTKDSAI